MARTLFTILLGTVLVGSVVAQSVTPDQAIALEQQGKLPEAAAAWRQVINKNPSDARAYASLGVVLSKQEKLAEAVTAYRKALSLNPKLPGIQMNLGLAEFKQGHFREAIPVFRAIVAAEANNAQARTLLGVSYYGDKQFPKAAQNLKLALKADPTNAELQQMLAQSCLAAHDYPCATAAFREILRQHPDSAAAHVLLGQALDGLGKTQEAIAEFEQAAKVSPREPNVHFGLGFLYWKSHEYAKAKQEFQAELANDPNHGQALGYLGDTELKQGNADSALPLLRRAVELKPDLRLAYIDLGVVLTDQKQYKQAIVALDKAVQLDPSQSDAHYRLARVYQLMGNTTQAEKEFREVQRLHQKSDVDRTPKSPLTPTPQQ